MPTTNSASLNLQVSALDDTFNIIGNFIMLTTNSALPNLQVSALDDTFLSCRPVKSAKYGSY